MRNRIRNIVKDYIEMYKENYTDLATLEKKYQIYKDLLYQNWKNDLISPEVIDGCYEELSVLSDFIIKEKIRATGVTSKREN